MPSKHLVHACKSASIVLVLLLYFPDPNSVVYLALFQSRLISDNSEPLSTIDRLISGQGRSQTPAIPVLLLSLLVLIFLHLYFDF
jgi:hypothetical protein